MITLIHVNKGEKMKKLKLTALIMAMFALFSANLWSQEVEEAEVVEETVPTEAKEKSSELPGLDIYTGVTSSYFFRGANLHSPATVDDEGNDEAFPVAPALQSGITIYAPIEGLYFDIWTSFALTDRETDAALYQVDEIDYTVGYDFENKAGAFGIKFINYALPNVSGPEYTDLLLSYTAPVLLSPTFVIANDLVHGATYLEFGISHELALSEELSFAPGVLYGYTFESGSPYYGSGGYVQLNLPLSFAATEDLGIDFTVFSIYNLDKQADTLPAVYAGVSLAATYSI